MGVEPEARTFNTRLTRKQIYRPEIETANCGFGIFDCD